MLLSASLAEDFYDLVDVDAFGGRGDLISCALGAVKLGGLVYLTFTDGLSAGGMAWGWLCCVMQPNPACLYASNWLLPCAKKILSIVFTFKGVGSNGWSGPAGITKQAGHVPVRDIGLKLPKLLWGSSYVPEVEISSRAGTCPAFFCLISNEIIN